MHTKILPRAICAAALIITVLAPGFGTASAQAKRTPTKPMTIAVVDVQSILRNSKASKSVGPQIGKMRSRYQAAVRKREGILRKESQDLQRQRAILSPDAFAKKRRAYEKRARAAQGEFQTRKRQLDGAYSIAMGKVQKSMLVAVAMIADERKFDLVLPKSIIILSAKSLDITKDILEQINKSLPSVKVTMPKANPTGGLKEKK